MEACWALGCTICLTSGMLRIFFAGLIDGSGMLGGEQC
jgi:hypothetical protein